MVDKTKVKHQFYFLIKESDTHYTEATISM